MEREGTLWIEAASLVSSSVLGTACARWKKFQRRAGFVWGCGALGFSQCPSFPSEMSPILAAVSLSAWDFRNDPRFFRVALAARFRSSSLSDGLLIPRPNRFFGEATRSVMADGRRVGLFSTSDKASELATLDAGCRSGLRASRAESKLFELRKSSGLLHRSPALPLPRMMTGVRRSRKYSSTSVPELLVTLLLRLEGVL